MPAEVRREALDDPAAAYQAPGSSERSGVALCLSGGGFRAALFHLGAARRLNEVGILSRVDTVSGVSGGSILAAHLAERIRRWPEKGEVIPDWSEQVAVPFRSLTSRNLGTGPMLRRLAPWNWDDPSTASRALARSLQRKLTGLRLGDLSERPRFVFCATDMVHGRFWIFEKRGVGRPDDELTPRPKWPVARAIAASACFPPVFAPLRVGLKLDTNGGAGDLPESATAPAERTHLTDGGTYDNTGIEAVWDDHATILVSDGGGVFDARWRNFWLWRLRPYQSITSARVRVLQQRWLFASFAGGLFDGAIWGIDEPEWDRRGVAVPGMYPRELIHDVISRVRTDLDAFGEAEQKVLENHGYLMAEAEAGVRALTPRLPAREEPPRAPHPEWLEPERVRRALAGSDERRLLGRPFHRQPLDVLFN